MSEQPLPPMSMMAYHQAHRFGCQGEMTGQSGLMPALLLGSSLFDRIPGREVAWTSPTAQPSSVDN